MKGWRYRQPYRLTDDDLGREYRIVSTGQVVTIESWEPGMTWWVTFRHQNGSKERLRRCIVEARINVGAWERA